MRPVARIGKRLAVNLSVAVIGFGVGVFALYVYNMRSGPDLELWHTAELEGEFTADRMQEIQDFEGYRQLERQLFAQLDEKIFARTPTGPAFQIARFSAGSASDPRRYKQNWNASFEFSAETPRGGVLLLHGMSDSPYSLRALAEDLTQRDYWVIGLRLPGHGTAPVGLTSVTWEDMAAAVRLAMTHLASRVGPAPIHVVGYSTGAPLALDYALDVLSEDAETMPASMVLISPAIAISPAAVLAKWMGRLAALPGLEKLAWSQISPEFDPFKYNSFAINAGDQVHRLTRSVAARIEAAAATEPIENFPPTLVLLSTVDATVSTDAVIDNLLEHLAPGSHELVLFDVNRYSAITTVLVSDPGPLTARLMANDKLPYGLTLITNENSQSREVIAQRKGALSTGASTESLNLAWPPGVISLSHVALPFPPDDPLYGQIGFATDDSLHLGQVSVQGERGLLTFSADWLMRLKHNPFYAFLERRVLDWLDSEKPPR